MTQCAAEVASIDVLLLLIFTIEDEGDRNKERENIKVWVMAVVLASTFETSHIMRAICFLANDVQ